jgi:hypothetical protein
MLYIPLNPINPLISNSILDIVGYPHDMNWEILKYSPELSHNFFIYFICQKIRKNTPLLFPDRFPSAQVVLLGSSLEWLPGTAERRGRRRQGRQGPAGAAAPKGALRGFRWRRCARAGHCGIQTAMFGHHREWMIWKLMIIFFLRWCFCNKWIGHVSQKYNDMYIYIYTCRFWSSFLRRIIRHKGSRWSASWHPSLTQSKSSTVNIHHGHPWNQWDSCVKTSSCEHMCKNLTYKDGPCSYL